MDHTSQINVQSQVHFKIRQSSSLHEVSLVFGMGFQIPFKFQIGRLQLFNVMFETIAITVIKIINTTKQENVYVYKSEANEFTLSP